MLNESLQEEFSRLGTSPIYQSKSRIVIARTSKRYDKKTVNYWYGTKVKDLDRVRKYRITHFAFICSDEGVVLIPTKTMLKEIEKDNLHKSTTKEGQLSHYHIYFYERDGSIYWRLKTENKKMDKFFFVPS